MQREVTVRSAHRWGIAPGTSGYTSAVAKGSGDWRDLVMLIILMR